MTLLGLLPLLMAVIYGLVMWQLSAQSSRRELDRNSTPLAEPRLLAMTERLAAALELERVRVHVYEIAPINGLAAPDGRIFLTRGFLDAWVEGKVSEEELASVIAHELGHVALGHSRRRMIDFSSQNAMRMALATMMNRFLPGLGAVIAQWLINLLAAGLSRSDEYEADAYAAALMVKAGFGTGPQKSLLSRLPHLTGAAGRPPVWLASHPASPDRVAAIEALEDRWRLPAEHR